MPNRLSVLAAAVFCLIAVHAHAASDDDDDEKPMPAAPAARQAVPGGPVASEAKPDDAETTGGSLLTSDTLFGDPGGLRSSLAAHGVTFGLAETAEVLANVTGGVRRGAAFEGLLAMSVGVDTEKAGLWSGGKFNVSAYQIHGRGLSHDNLGENLNTVSGIEASRATVLFEAWYEQALFDRNVTIRVGQLALDQEFAVSQYGELFINRTFGLSTLFNESIQGGGSSLLLAQPAIRVKASFPNNTKVLFGVFEAVDNAGGMGRSSGGILAIGEVQHGLGTGEGQFAGTYKLGGTYQSNTSFEQRTGQRRHGNWSVYAVADQLIWRKPGSKDEGIGVFARAQGAPGDRNLINLYLDAGLTWKGIIGSREDDTAGIGVGYARISDTARRSDPEFGHLGNLGRPLRNNETVLELTYQAEITPWLQVQPTAQYIFNLNGGVQNPAQPGKRLSDAAVIGLRTEITF